MWLAVAVGLAIILAIVAAVFGFQAEVARAEAEAAFEAVVAVYERAIPPTNEALAAQAAAEAEAAKTLAAQAIAPAPAEVPATNLPAEIEVTETGDFTLWGSIKYRSSSDSPFYEDCGEKFTLEDFENFDQNKSHEFRVLKGQLTTSFDPWYKAEGNIFIDSVNKEEPANERESFANTGKEGVTFSFDPYDPPTHVGIVWTDGEPKIPTLFEVVDSNGVTATIGPIIIADDTVANSYVDDYFFGAFNENGIQSITIKNIGSDLLIEVDHLQWCLN